MHDFQNYMKNKDIEKRKHKFFEMNSGTGPGPILEAAEGGRIGFAAGGGRRAFLKLLAALGGGIAGFKTGILGLGGKSAGKKAVTETIKQSAGSGTPPPYFFKLVEKIKTMGDDIGATQDRTIAKSMKSKDGKSEYILEEDVSTGDTLIKKINKESDDMVTDVEIMQHSKGQADEFTKGKKPADSYEEVTEYNSRIYKDNFNEPDYVDGIKVDEILEEVGETVTKKADGGRIGFSAGNLAKLLAGKKITGSSRSFLEKVFGKTRFEEMIKGDPELHRGMLEVVEMFRNKDREGLKMYMQKFLPHMDDATVEEFIVGTRPDIEGIQGQLLRLGSGRDYAGKIEMMKSADNMRALEKLDVEDMKPNAEGGRIGKWMGGPLGIGKGQLRKLLEFMAKGSSHGKTPSEMLQMINPKQFNQMLNKPEGIPSIAKEMIEKYTKQMKTDRTNMVGDLIGTGRKMKKADDDIIKYKIQIVEDMVSKGADRTNAVRMADNIAEMVSGMAGKKATPQITERGLLEMENLQKNLITKDRKLQANGGLTTMLGE